MTDATQPPGAGVRGAPPKSGEATDVVRPDATWSPGDQALPGTPEMGENVCPTCSGRGRLEGGVRCETCGGSGVIIEAVGGGG